VIANEVGARLGKEIKMGRLNWQADSYHIYGRDIEKAKAMLFDRIESMTLEERTMEFNDPFIRGMYDEAEARILSKIKEHDRSH
jgi:thymidylate synthase